MLGQNASLLPSLFFKRNKEYFPICSYFYIDTFFSEYPSTIISPFWKDDGYNFTKISKVTLVLDFLVGLSMHRKCISSINMSYSHLSFFSRTFKRSNIWKHVKHLEISDSTLVHPNLKIQ